MKVIKFLFLFLVVIILCCSGYWLGDTLGDKYFTGWFFGGISVIYIWLLFCLLKDC